MRNFVRSIALVLLFALACGAMCACKKAGGRPFDYLVTFDYNLTDEQAENYKELKNLYLGVKNGAKIPIQPGESNEFKAQAFESVYIRGWYLPELAADGSPVVEESGAVKLGKKWDFSADVVTSDVTLYAGFADKPWLVVRDADDDTVIQEFCELPGKITTLADYPDKPIARDGYSLYDVYEDKECTAPFGWYGGGEPFTFGETDKTVYAKFYEGNWRFVKGKSTAAATARDFISALSSGKDLWLDVSEIDFSDVNLTGSGWSLSKNIKGKEGRTTLKGIKLDFEYDGNNYKSGFGIFAKIAEGVTISDVTFDAEVTYEKVMNGTEGNYVAFFAYELGENVTLKNVTLHGTLTVKKAVNVGPAPSPVSKVNKDYENLLGENKLTAENFDFADVKVTNENVTANNASGPTD